MDPLATQTWDFTKQGPTHPQLVHWEARTVGKWMVRILLEYFLHSCAISNPMEFKQGQNYATEPNGDHPIKVTFTFKNTLRVKVYASEVLSLDFFFLNFGVFLTH